MSAAADQHEDDARRFAGAFMAGQSTGTGDPLLALMRYAMALQTPAQQTRSVKLKNAGIRHLLAFAKTWNAWRADEPLALIRITDNDRVVPFL